MPGRLLDDRDHLGHNSFVANTPVGRHVPQENFEVDVVLTDVQMPGSINGFGLAKWIRENRPGLPVFVASGFSGKLDAADELCAGEELFHKPFDVNEAVAKIKRALEARKPQVV